MSLCKRLNVMCFFKLHENSFKTIPVPCYKRLTVTLLLLTVTANRHQYCFAFHLLNAVDCDQHFFSPFVFFFLFCFLELIFYIYTLLLLLFHCTTVPLFTFLLGYCVSGMSVKISNAVEIAGCLAGCFGWLAGWSVQQNMKIKTKTKKLFCKVNAKISFKNRNETVYLPLRS